MIMQTERTSSPPAHEAERQIEALLTEFDRWAASADRRDDGWESDFPQWRELMAQAGELMAQGHQSEQALFLLSRCWSLSQECEECAYWAREHILDGHVRKLVFRLTKSVDPGTRWQAYDVLDSLSVLDAETRTVLQRGTKDENPYVRRRALLVFLHHSKPNKAACITQMLEDADAYNRYVAVKEGKRSGGEALQKKLLAVLQDPEVASHFAYYLGHKELIDQFDK